MKKTLCIFALICVLLASLTVSASAQTVEPLMPELLRQVLAGKTFTARMDSYFFDESMEHIILGFQICEKETYPAEAIEALKPGDTILVGGEEFLIKEFKQEDFGYEAVGETYSIILTKNDAGLYTAISDTETSFFKNLFLIEADVGGSDFRFVDASAGDDVPPTVLNVQEMVKKLSNGEIHSNEDNTKITFDENGKLVEFLYTYSPWN